MKQILFIISLTLLIGCNEKKKNNVIENTNQNDSITKESKPEIVPTESKNAEIDTIINRNQSLKNEFKHFKVFKLTDTIKADFNGDKITYLAYLSIKNEQKKMYVLDGKTKTVTKIGEDKSFGDMSEEFDWVDFWGTTDDKETYEIIIEDDEIAGDTITKLINKSIFVRKQEVGGGVVTFKDNRYIWIHQSD